MDAARAALTALAGVLTRGATEQDLDWLAELDGLDEVCAWSEDQRLAEHERVMGRGVFAWESVFTREDAPVSYTHLTLPTKRIV